MHFFFDFFLKCVPIIAKMRYLCGGFPETMARPDGGMVDTRDLKSLGLYGCAGSSPAWGTKRRASSSLSSVFVFPSVPLTLLLTLLFASTRPLPCHRKPRFRLGHNNWSASPPLSSVFIFPSVPLTLLLTLRFASTRPLPCHRKPRFRLGHLQLRHSHPAICSASVHHPPHSPAPLSLYTSSLSSPFLLPFCRLLKGESQSYANLTSAPNKREMKYVLRPFLSNYR